MNFLLGNTFPISLIRREVKIKPVDLDSLRKLGQQGNCYSFWGHQNSIDYANEILGFDVTPKEQRVPLKLNSDKLPTLYGESFTECWILSPNLETGLRPAIGREITPTEIKKWCVLKVTWV
jgi:hypothetical protein